MDTGSQAPAHRAAVEGPGQELQGPAARVLGRQLGASPVTGLVLDFPSVSGWGNVGGNWSLSVSADAATFEAWIRTTAKASQTIVIGSNPPGATPRISVGGDQISVYWNPGGSAPGWTSADTTPVTDGQWHHIAVVFDAGAITFYKDGVATADELEVSGAQQAAGAFQLGAGFGAATGFVGQLYDVRVWSVARSAQQIASWRWAPLSSSAPGLTARTSFDPAKQEIINLAGGAAGSIAAGRVITTDLPVPSCALCFGGGSSDGVLILSHAQFGSTAATFECWLKMSTAAGVAATGQPLMCVMQMGDPQQPLFAYAGDDTLSFTWNNISYRSADTRPVSDGAWHHVAVVFNQNYVTFYKDGVEDDALTSGADAGQILLGLANFALGIAGSSLDLGLLYVMNQWSSLAPANPAPNPLLNFLNYVDFALDFIGWALGVVVSYGWVAWADQDWIFWGIQGAPQIANFVYLFRSDGNNDKQVARDTMTGVGMLLLSAVYAHFWPASYCDAPKAKGLVLSSNIFGSISSLSEAPLLVGNPWLWLELVIPVKITGYVVSDVLGLTAYVLGLVD